jgi:2-methylcitrate dehydratase PrpD
MAIVTPGVLPATQLIESGVPEWLDAWAGFSAKLQFSDLPREVVDRTRLVLLDCLGAIIAGRSEPEVGGARRALPALFGGGEEQSPLLQAFIGGTAGTMLEIDEGNQYARGHPGIHVVPAVLGLALRKAISGQDAIAAIALGYEIGARIGIASKLRVTMHPHGTWGTVGAALAVAKLHGASAQDTAAAINVASSFGLTTSRRTMLEGATVRNTYAGFSNMFGLLAWSLVQSGFTGERDGVAAVYGGIAADDWRPEEMTNQLGLRWEIARNYFKRHAACRYTHAALDALADITAQAGGRLEAAAIERITVETYVWAAQLDHPAPANMLAAKFSLPFAIATTIVNGTASLDAFRDAARADPATRSLAARVTVTEDPALTALLPALRPARVTAHLKDGRILRAMAKTNKGDTEDPYSRTEVIAKFHEVATPSVGAERVREIEQFVESLDGQRSLAPLVALLET